MTEITYAGYRVRISETLTLEQETILCEALGEMRKTRVVAGYCTRVEKWKCQGRIEVLSFQYSPVGVTVMRLDGKLFEVTGNKIFVNEQGARLYLAARGWVPYCDGRIDSRESGFGQFG